MDRSARANSRDGVTHQRRMEAAKVVELAAHLNSSDRALLEGIYLRGMAASAMARAAGVSPRMIRRRVQRLLERMNSPAFHYVLQGRAHWPAERRAIAEAVFLRGEGQRQTAALAEVTVHRVRREVERIRAVAEHAGRQLLSV